ncbi:YhgE/Pip domain-containing protein [Corynebacterium sp. A21]|uniref:YhgE/Pip domain-containing protein n=1 Tax=Corynebacterium sp. A21 TaxID=3457318 RepID=UPI003FCF1415
MSSFRSRLLALLVIIPLIIGAVYLAIAGIGPDRSWSAAGDSSGAPAADSPAGIDPAELVDARRAASEAGAQAGFLATGTGELVDGTGLLREGAGDLVGGVEEAKGGAQQLAEGMVQLQAATGQLGTGANQVADGVALAVEQVTGLSAIQMQLIQAIDGINTELAKSKVPEAKEIRSQLAGFRTQVEAFPLTGENADQLDQLRTGAREVANQLAVPGYGFHDGVYSATDGAQRLNEGLSQLQGGVGTAVDGVNELDDGAQRLEQMATATQDKLGNVQRSLPAVQTPESGAGAADGQAVAAAQIEESGSLAPMYALLIGVLAALGGIAVGYLGSGSGRWIDRILGGAGIVALSGILYALLSQGMTLLSLSAGVAVLALMTAASTGLTLIARRVAGDRWGGLFTIFGAIIQVGLVGWVWKSAAAAEVSTVWEIIASLTPLHYATAALTANGNAGDPTLVWLGAAVLAAVAVLSFVVLLGGRREAAALAD